MGFAREKTAHGITLQEHREKAEENEKVHLLRSLGVHPQREKAKAKAKAAKEKAENPKARVQLKPQQPRKGERRPKAAKTDPHAPTI